MIMGHQALVIVQVRFNSTRLLGKVLLPLHGIPMLVYVIRRLKILSSSYKIIIATTEKLEDDLIVAWANEEGIESVRGEENDVLARYIRCIETFPSNIIVRVTADNPLTDPEIITQVITLMKEGEYDYIRGIDGYPVGVGVDAFSDKLLKVLNKNSTSDYEREHINAFVLNKRKMFKTYDLPVPPNLNCPDLSFTVDTFEDYKKVKEFIESYPLSHFITLEDAIERTRKRNI